MRIHDCLEGEEVILSKREEYLPYPVGVLDVDKNTAEFESMYNLFLQGGHFVEYTSEAVEDLVSAAFRRPLEVRTPDGSEQADLGTLDYLNLEILGRDLVAGVGAYGRQFLLVDYPDVATTPTVADDVKNKAYITLYDPLDVVDWKETYRSGQAELLRVVLREIDETDESDEVRWMFREITLEAEGVVVKIHKENKDVIVINPQANGKPLREIPGLFIGTTSNTARVDKSPVIGIANSNIKHYQTWAELLHTQTFIGHPHLVLEGLTPGWGKAARDEGFKLRLDAGEILTLEGDKSKANLLQIDTNNLIHFRTLEILEQSMFEQGARIKSVSRKAGVESAQALKIRSSASMSKLAAIVDNVEEGLLRAIKWAGLYMGVEADYLVSINKEFYSPEPDGGLLSSISTAEAGGTAPRGTAITYLKQIELLDDNISNDEYVKKLPPLINPAEAGTNNNNNNNKPNP